MWVWTGTLDVIVVIWCFGDCMQFMATIGVYFVCWFGLWVSTLLGGLVWMVVFGGLLLVYLLFELIVLDRSVLAAVYVIMIVDCCWVLLLW